MSNSPKTKKKRVVSEETVYVVEVNNIKEERTEYVNIFKKKHLNTKEPINVGLHVNVHHPRYKSLIPGIIHEIIPIIYDTYDYIYDLEDVLTEDINGLYDTKRSEPYKMGDVFHVPSKDVFQVSSNNAELKKLLNPDAEKVERLLLKIEKQQERTRQIGDLDFGMTPQRSNESNESSIKIGSYVQIRHPEKYFGAKFAKVKRVYNVQPPKVKSIKSVKNKKKTINFYNISKFEEKIAKLIAQLAFRKDSYMLNTKDIQKYIKTNHLYGNYLHELVLRCYKKLEKSFVGKNDTFIVENIAREIYRKHNNLDAFKPLSMSPLPNSNPIEFGRRM